MVTRHEDVQQIANTVETKLVQDFEHFDNQDDDFQEDFHEHEDLKDSLEQEEQEDVQEEDVQEDFVVEPVAAPVAENALMGSYDLLPKSSSCPTWGELSSDGLPELLEPSARTGIDTVVSSLRNSSYDIRSTPIIEKKDIFPWMNSNIGPDLTRKPLDDCNDNVLASSDLGGYEGYGPASL